MSLSGMTPDEGAAMTDSDIKARTRAKPKVERPKMYKVILLNDDFTPREFVVKVLKAEFGMGEDRAYAVMLTAHRKGVCVVYAKDIAETKTDRANDRAQRAGYPLRFTMEPEE